MIRDRGKIKWKSAFFMPEHVKMLRDIKQDELKINKPILDEYQVEEFEQKIHLAMELTWKIKIQVWEDGFIYEYLGLLIKLDELNKVIYMEEAVGTKIRINFNNIVDILIEKA